MILIDNIIYFIPKLFFSYFPCSDISLCCVLAPIVSRFQTLVWEQIKQISCHSSKLALDARVNTEHRFQLLAESQYLGKTSFSSCKSRDYSNMNWNIFFNNKYFQSSYVFVPILVVTLVRTNHDVTTAEYSCYVCGKFSSVKFI